MRELFFPVRALAGIDPEEPPLETSVEVFPVDLNTPFFPLGELS